MKKIIKILFLILLNSSTVFAQYQYPTAEQLHNFQGGGGIGIPITCSLGEQYFPISPQLRSTVDNFNLAMGVIGISHVGRGLYHFGANLADNTKLALANNESIRAIVTAKFLDWKVSITNLDNLNDAEKILIQEGRIAELRMVDGINTKLTDADFTSLEKQWDGWRMLGVNGVGSLWATFLDDAFTLQKRAEVISQGLPAQFPNLTIDELTAIKVYTSDEVRNGVKIYSELNSQLRLGNLDNYYQGLHKLLDDGLSKMTPYSGSTVFRGCGSTESQIARNWNLGDEIKFNDFKSASTASTEAGDFVRRGNGDVIYEIANPTGYNVCPISCSPDEMEILFRTGGKFKVTEIIDNVVIYDKDFNVVTSTGRKIKFDFVGYD